MAGQKAKPATKKVEAAKAVTTGKKGAVKKPAAKKPATKETGAAVKKAATPVAEKKATATKAKIATAKPAITKRAEVKPTPEERYRMVEITAYFIAERSGFQGDSTEHWSAAEREIAAKLDG